MIKKEPQKLNCGQCVNCLTFYSWGSIYLGRLLQKLSPENIDFLLWYQTWITWCLILKETQFWNNVSIRYLQKKMWPWSRTLFASKKLDKSDTQGKWLKLEINPSFEAGKLFVGTTFETLKSYSLCIFLPIKDYTFCLQRLEFSIRSHFQALRNGY